MQIKSKKIKKESQCKMISNLAYEVSLLIYDGIGFFKYHDYKLDRLKGTTVNFFTKCKNVKYMMRQLTMICFAMQIIMSEYQSMGKMKSQTIQMKQLIHLPLILHLILRLILHHLSVSVRFHLIYHHGVYRTVYQN